MHKEKAKELKPLFDELRSTQLKEMELRNLIMKELRNYLADNGQFKSGDCVEVIDKDSDKILGLGFIGGTRLKFNLDPLEVKYITEKTSYLEDELEHIYYEVFAMKANGTASKKHFFETPHSMPAKKHKYSDFHLKLKQP